MRILFLGDIAGRAGREAVAARVPALRREWNIDAVVANGENASGGIGLSAANATELLACGIDVITSGNHIWRHKNIYSVLVREPRLLRPANYPAPAKFEGGEDGGATGPESADASSGAPGTAPGSVPGYPAAYTPPPAPGRGLGIYNFGGTRVAVINLLGTTFMEWAECPFRTADALLAQVPDDVAIRLVDFHAEATSEKKALGWYLDGRVSALIGTHTHVQTADAMILPRGTGYLTDAGLCGVEASVLGVDHRAIVQRFLTRMPVPFTEAKGQGGLNGVLLDIAPDGRCLEIRLVREGAG